MRRSHLKFPVPEFERERMLNGWLMEDERTPEEVAAYRRAASDLSRAEAERGHTDPERLLRDAADEILSLGDQATFHLLFGVVRAMWAGPDAVRSLGAAVDAWLKEWHRRSREPIPLAPPTEPERKPLVALEASTMPKSKADRVNNAATTTPRVRSRAVRELRRLANSKA